MAPSVSWMLCFVAALTAQLAVVLAVDQERFPLSGGVANGVNVQFKISNLNQGVTIDFLNASRSCVFRFHVDVEKKQVVRTDEQGDPEMWGGWPWPVDAPLTDVVFDFHKTKFYWAISIGSMRMPFFDFAHRSEDMVVHALVTTDADKMVIQTRPQCEKTCHPSECVADTGNTCPDGNCFTRHPMTSNGHAACSTSMNSGSHVDAECCTGRALAADYETIEREQWFDVLPATTADDQAYLKHVCDAFNLDCDAVAGTKVKALMRKPMEHTIQVFSPVRAVDMNQKLHNQSIPSYLLTPAVAQKLLFTMTRPQMRQVTVLGDDASAINDGLISGFVDNGAQMPADWPDKYWYINMLTASFTDYATDPKRWFAYFDDRWDHEASLKDDDTFEYQVLLADYDAPATSCADDDTFVDNNQNKCSDYTANKWCNEHGKPMGDFCTANGLASNCNLYQVITSGESAPWACCECGGGVHETPAEAVVVAPPPDPTPAPAPPASSELFA